MTSIPLTQWTFLVGQNRFMQERGLEVHAVASPGPLLDALARRDGVLVHPVAIPRRFAPWRDLVALCRLIALFRRLRPDIVQAGTPKASLLGAAAAFLARVPARIFHWHGSITEGARGMRRLIFGLLESLTAALCHDVLCVSPSLLSYVRGHRLLPAGRGAVILRGMCNGIDIGRFDPARPGIAPESETLARSMELPQDPVVIGFVGRLTRRKGIEDLASAWSVLREEYAGAHLLPVGGWEDEDPVSPSVRAALEGDPRVRMPGPVEDVVPTTGSCPFSFYRASGRDSQPPRWRRPRWKSRPSPTASRDRPTRFWTARPGGLSRSGRSGARSRHPGLHSRSRDEEATWGGGPTAGPGGVPAGGGLGGDLPALRRAARSEQEWGYASRKEAPARAPRCRPLRAPGKHGRRHPGPRRDKQAVKRTMDIVLSLAALAVLSPVLAAIAVAVALGLGRPVLFRQVRIGRAGKRFVILKFRSMAELRGEAGRLLPDRDRLTRFGRFLRSTSLDELPELVNVLKGDMSFVGPRPLLPEYLPLYSPEQARRHEVRPGITGWAQVNGRNILSWEEKFRLDVWYVDHRSLRLDLAILAKTLLLVAARQGISAEGSATMPVFTGSRKEDP